MKTKTQRFFSPVFLLFGFLFFFSLAGGANAATSSGTFESNPINFGSPVSMSTISWTATGTSTAEDPATCTGTSAAASAGCAVRFQVAVSSDGSTWNSYVGPANSTSEYFITSGGDISFFGNWQYVKFKAYLYSVDGALYTASVSDVTIVSSGYSTSNSLISSAYDTTDPYNTLSGVSWTESNVSGAQDVKLQIRTSNDNVTWTSWYGPTSTADYFDYTNGSNGCTKAGSVVTCSTIPTVFTSGYDDRYVEYQVYLLTGGGISITPPSVSSVAVTYLDNRTPSFESATIDVGNAANFTSISWTATGIDSNTETPGACNTSLTTGSGCAVRFQIALKDVDSAWTDADFKGPDGQNSTYFVSSGTLISNAVFGSHRYIRYRVYLRSINPTTYSPAVSDVTLPYGGYPAEGTFTSSPFNTTDSSAIFGKMAWTATGTTTLETVSFQVRYAPDNAGAPGTWSSWCGYADVGTLPTDCAGTNEFSYLYNNVSTPSGNPLLSSGSHQWMQYKMFLRSGSGTGTPVVSSISMYYVVNAPPEVQMVGTPSQSTTDGKVTITYSTKDIDTALGTNTPNFVTPSFEYWNGSSWSVISSSALATGDLTQKAVNSSTLTQYTATWSPALSFSTATTTEQIRVTVNDGEASHATATATSNAFSMDSKAPVITVATAAPYTTYLVGTSTASNLNITSSDDNTYQIMLSNNADFSSDGINASSGAWITPASSLTWNFGATPVTVYLKAKDAYQNVSSTVTMSAPDTPTDFFISDITTASDFREFVSWQVASSTPGDFLNYQVYKSTDGGTTYSLFQTITDRLLNYVVDSGLSGTQTYYYKALAKDTSGNISPYSTAAYDQPNLARGTTDLVAPVMSNAACSGISTSQLTVTWDTDKISDSSVYYSSLGAATTASASSTVPSMVKNSASTIGGHSVTLTGLNPSRTYNLLLKSVDPYGNTATNSTLLPSCSTLGGPKISTVQASSVGETTATIHWTTDTLSDSVVEYSTDALFATYGTAPLANSVTDHYVNLTSLSVNTKYYYRVKSTDVNGLATDNNGGNFYTFTTTIDTTPPIISSVQAALTRYDSAVITWSTDELADSFVSSITGGTATVPALDTVLTTKHSVVLTGLTAETIYTYNVTSRDGATAHNSATSASYTFTTPAQDKIVVRIDTSKTVVPLDTGVTQQATVQLVVDETPPRVTNLKVVDISDSQATIQWTTDEPATSLVEYGETNKYGFATGSFTYAKDHSVTLKDLRAGREFNYQIRSIDAAGNFNESANKVFSTNPATLTIEEKIAQLQKVNNLAEIEAITKEIEDLLDTVGNKVQPPLIIGDTPKVEVGSSFVKISWNTNRPSGSVIAYSDEMDYNANIPDVYGALSGDADERVTAHEVLISNLNPGTTYHYQLRSKALVGGTGRSRDFTFTTKAEAGISDLEIKNITINSAELTWKTSVPASTRVEYGLTSQYTDTRSDDAFNTTHLVKLTKLNPGTLYRFRVGGIDSTKKEFFSPNLTFTTDALPSLIDVKIDGVTEKSANVSWTTDLVSDSTVYYTNTKTNQTNKFGGKEFVRNHEVKLDSLEEGITYVLKVASTDEKGNTVESSEYTFTTSKDVQPPLISNVKTQSALFGKDRVQTIISWTTSEPATDQLFYQEGLVKGAPETATRRSDGYTTNHTVVLTKFKPGNIYKFRIEALDPSGNATKSQDFTILTPQEEATVFDLIITNFKDVFKWTGQINK